MTEMCKTDPKPNLIHRVHVHAQTGKSSHDGCARAGKVNRALGKGPVYQQRDARSGMRCRDVGDWERGGRHVSWLSAGKLLVLQCPEKQCIGSY